MRDTKYRQLDKHKDRQIDKWLDRYIDRQARGREKETGEYFVSVLKLKGRKLSGAVSDV